MTLLIPACTQDTSLQNKVKELEYKIAVIDNSVTNMESELYLIKTQVEEQEATIDPSSKGYDVAKSKLGNFLVTFKDIKPYGDGQKISLLIGNPYNITFNGYTIDVRHSLRWPEYPKNPDSEARKRWSEEFKKFTESQKEKQFVMTEKLLPGQWNKATIVIAPAKPEEVGSIRIKIFTNQVMLYGG